jgi:N-acetylglucosaminyldiphosphoundecaprenol N-acetyl-beta-D-mannosaminyltransferase
MDKINILGVSINKVIRSQAAREAEKFLLDGRRHYIVTPNPEFLMAAQKDSEFKKILNEADMAVPDGVGLLWAATLKSSKFKAQSSKQQFKTQSFKTKLWLKGLFYGLLLMIWPRFCQKVLPERVTGVDMIFAVVKLCQEKKFSIYLLGGEKGIAVAAALKLKQRYPRLEIVGAEEGMQYKNPKSKIQISNQILNSKSQIPNKIQNSKFQIQNKNNEKLLSRINKAEPDVLLVAFGQVKQEKWIYKNLKKLPTVKIAIGVGGAFNFIAGTIKRAPFLFQKIGLEWFWRLIRQPWRFNRIITATFRFAKAVIKDIKKTE